jgi:outer membrane lipoprotein LolB
MNLARGLAACAVAMLLSGCAVFAPGGLPPAAGPFDILGRVLASNDGRAFSSNFRWRHDTDGDEIWLMSPVGQTLAYILADAGGATLTAADQQEYRALSVENLTRRVLGWPLPLARLQHWINGEAAPDQATATVARDAQGRVAALEQDGWSIRYTYPESVAGAPLPRRLDMAQGTQQIRMIIDDWRRSDAP